MCQSPVNGLGKVMGGQYYPWIEAGMLEDWIIINCAISLPSGGI